MNSRLREKRQLCVCVLLFLLGGIVGCALGRAANTETAQLVWSKCSEQRSVIATALVCCAMPAAVLFFGTSVIGYLFVPLVDAAGGFAVAYLMTASMCAVGTSFETASFFALPSFVGVACFIWLSALSMDISRRWGRDRRGTAGQGYVREIIVCAAVLLALSVILFLARSNR